MINICKFDKSKYLNIFYKRYHLVRLNNPIPMHMIATKGLNLSPITAALLNIPLNPFLCDSTKLGHIALIYEAVHIINKTTIIILSKLKNAL